MGFSKFSRVMMNSFVRLSKIQWFRKWSSFLNVSFWGMCPIFGLTHMVWTKIWVPIGEPTVWTFYALNSNNSLVIVQPSRGGLLVFPVQIARFCRGQVWLSNIKPSATFGVYWFQAISHKSQLGWSNKTSPKQQTTSQSCASTSIMAHL